MVERPRHRRVPLGDAVSVRQAEHFILEDIDVETGVAHINSKVLLDEPGTTKLVCYWNARKLLADGVFAENELAVRPVYRPLLEHDARRSRR